MHRGSHIEESNCRQQQSPERIEAVKPDGWPEADRHQEPARGAQQSWNQMTAEQQSRRSKVCDGKSQDGGQQKQFGVPQLIEGCARDHMPDGAQRIVRTDAARFWTEAEPDSSAASLNAGRERAVINNFIANGLYASGFEQCIRANEDASAG